MNIGGAAKSGLKSAFLKPISLALGLLYMPLLLDYLGNEQYGVWATVLSVVSWINYCDVGVGNGLRNVLTIALTKNDRDRATRAVSTAYLCLTGVAALLLMGLLIALPLADWNGLFNTSLEIRPMLGITFTLICVNFVLSLCNFLRYALQESAAVSLQQVAVQIINILGVLMLRARTSASLVRMAWLFGLSSLAVYAISTLQLMKTHPFLRPRRSRFDRALVGDINRVGLKFFVSQLAFLALHTTGNLVVSHCFGPEEVTPLSIANRVFDAGLGVFVAFLTPYWSKTTENRARGDVPGIRRTFRRLNVLACLFCLGCAAVALLFRPVVNLWLGKQVVFSDALIAATCLYAMACAFHQVSGPMINGLGEIDGVLPLHILQGALNIPLSLFLGVSCGLGPAGVRLAGALLVGAGVVYQGWYLSRKLKRLEQQNTSVC